jgi:hypothetical protein
MKKAGKIGLSRTFPDVAGSCWNSNGGAEGDRTLDLRIANATLSQLSYRPTRRAILAGPTQGFKGFRGLFAVAAAGQQHASLRYREDGGSGERVAGPRVGNLP